MAKSKGYVIALLAGILALFSFIAPVAYEESTIIDVYIWIWAFYMFRWGSGDWNYEWLNDANENVLTYGLIAFLLLVIATLVLLYTGYKTSNNYGNYSSAWIVCGVLLFVAPIIYIIVTTDENFFFNEFWNWLHPHYGIIGPFIAGILAITAGYIDKR